MRLSTYQTVALNLFHSIGYVARSEGDNALAGKCYNRTFNQIHGWSHSSSGWNFVKIYFDLRLKCLETENRSIISNYGSSASTLQRLQMHIHSLVFVFILLFFPLRGLIFSGALKIRYAFERKVFCTKGEGNEGKKMQKWIGKKSDIAEIISPVWVQRMHFSWHFSTRIWVYGGDAQGEA